MDFYFKNTVDICREVLLGKVDFKLYRNEEFENKLLIEIKKATNTLILKNCFNRQLVKY